jgi:hypothetical protein
VQIGAPPPPSFCQEDMKPLGTCVYVRMFVCMDICVFNSIENITTSIVFL